MGLLPGSLMPGLVEDLALPGSWMPFGQAAKMIGHFRKIEVWEATVRRVSEEERASPGRNANGQAAALEGEMGEAPE